MMYDVNGAVNGAVNDARVNSVILFVSIGLMMSIFARTAVRVESLDEYKMRYSYSYEYLVLVQTIRTNAIVNFREASLSILPKRKTLLGNADVKRKSSLQFF